VKGLEAAKDVDWMESQSMRCFDTGYQVRCGSPGLS
jgi:hypothetical protein